MAWNEPGGSGGKDPWGGSGKGQEPPDLDEVIRNLQRKLKALLSSGSGKKGGDEDGADREPPSGEGIALGGLGVVAAVLLVAWVVSGFYIVEEGYRAVVTRFGAYNESSEPGLHWYPRFIEAVQQVDVSSVRSAKLGYQADESLMLTQDENIIDIRFDVQYQLKDDPEAARDYLFNVRDPDETLRQATASAVREVIGKSKMDFIITEGRSTIAMDSERILQDTLDMYQTGLMVIQLTMQNAQAPQQVKQAFDDVVEAREDSERYKNEAKAYAQDILPKAKGHASRLTLEAEGYRDAVIAAAQGESDRFIKVLTEYEKAPEIMRKRLYLAAMETVFQQSGKVIVDTKSSNNLLYLPLDKIRSGGVGAGGEENSMHSSSRSTLDPGVNLMDNRSFPPVRGDGRNRGVRQ
ncbi:MAG: FtsH protease activity modulator HflK [Gammaproteobacteria bacterium]|nr:FtsH protease activity modulator HflK [Gammaproteobacteria bacterium]